MRNVILVAIVLACAVATLAGQPAVGAEDFYDLYSARMLAEGSPIVGGLGPQSDAINPATSATVQRTTLDASYLAITGFGSPLAGGGWQGHVVNLGLVLPTRVGVFSGSTHFLSMPLAGMPWGTTVAVHGTAAKELYPGWMAGTGLRVVAGGRDRFDFGAALDLGLVREMGDYAGLKDFRWGVALQNVGKWYTPGTESGPLPAPFTPVGGVAFDAISTDWFRLGFSTTMAAPAFQNVRFGIGTRMSFWETVVLHGGWKADLVQLIDDTVDRRSLVPSFGLSFRFRAGFGEEGFAGRPEWSETEVRPTLAAAPLYNDVWAIGAGINAPLGIIDVVGPEVTVTYPQRVYISPNNDGIQDALTFPITITDDRFVMEWVFEVFDSAGARVRTIRNIDDRPENTGFQNIVDRILAVQTGVPVPPQIRWDGRTDDGSVAPDGTYRFQVSAVDDNGNIGTSGVYTVHVDTTPPRVDIASIRGDDLIFSPNDDGIKDELIIDQTGSEEDLWTAQILNASNRPIRTFEFRNSAPLRIVWDGTGDDGEIQPDGVYRYRISATDRAGNSTSAEIANIIVNTEATPVGIRISDSHFSPNADGVQDTIRIEPDVPNPRGIVEWSLTVRTVAGAAVRSYGDIATVPTPVVFDGRSEAGAVIAEGEYFAELEVVYRSGNRPSAQSAVFVVDVTPPFASARSDVALFSPDGDGNIDTVAFFNEASPEDLWTARIYDRLDRVVRSFTWSGVPPQRIVWDGRGDDGRLVADGIYRYVLTATDRAGNTGSSNPVVVEVDTSGAEIAIQAEFDAFSPNANGVRDQQRFEMRVDRPADVATYRISVVRADGTLVRRFEGRGQAPASRVWDGTQEDGRRAADGSYRAVFEAVFTNGFEASAQTAFFTIDTQAPTVTVSTEYTLFSPDGDGNRDSILIRQETSDEQEWVAAIRAADGTSVREFRWTGRAGDLRWDGTDRAGNVVADGVYVYEISSRDRAGNSASATIRDIRVDTRIPRLFVTASSDAMSPNGNGIRETVRFDLFANVLDGSDGWRLTIRDRAGLTIREFTGSTIRVEHSVVWDGRDGRGQVREGTFVAEYAIDYTKGNRARATSTPVLVDITPPVLRVTLDPVPFSPDNDGIDDQLSIGLSVENASPIQAWRFEILDRNRRFFNEFTGRGMPASRLIWDGRASDGELVISAEDYPYRFTVTDVLGNTAVAEGIIPVDILVIRDGDRLRVQISNITFAPNSPELVLDPNDERGAKNLAILKRLAEVFAKYGSYSIRIEGHAVNVTGTEREERDELQPLSLSRATSVRAAMVAEGIAERRISVLGRGGTEPLVPHTDLDNRWKNRRVEFILIR